MKPPPGSRVVSIVLLTLCATGSGFALGRLRPPVDEAPPATPVATAANAVPALHPTPLDVAEPRVVAESSLAPAPPVVKRVDLRRAPACDGVSVRGIVAAREPAWSFALLDRGDGAILRRPGQAFGERRILHVASDRVYLFAPSTATTYAVCQAELGAAPLVARAPRVAASPSPVVASAGLDPLAHIGSRIEARGPRDFVIDRGALDELIENQASLMSHVRAAPEMVDGRMLGVKLLFVRGGGVLDKLGLKTGDALMSINGMELTSPEKILAAYARLTTAPRLSLTILRDGAPTQVDYEIR